MKSYIVHWFIHDENPPNSLFFDGVSTYIGVAWQASDAVMLWTISLDSDDMMYS